MGIGLAHDYMSFLLFRLAIGGIGASFVVTQYHSSVMFAPNVVGRAAAITAGWGNLGGGVAQIATPFLMTGIVSLGVSQAWGWRLSMVVPGALMFVWGLLYAELTQDFPAGNVEDGVTPVRKYGESTENTFLIACKDYRVWALFLTYASCFGIELTFHNLAALYYKDMFSLSLTTAGLVAGSYGLMNLFARVSEATSPIGWRCASACAAVCFCSVCSWWVKDSGWCCSRNAQLRPAPSRPWCCSRCSPRWLRAGPTPWCRSSTVVPWARWRGSSGRAATWELWWRGCFSATRTSPCPRRSAGSALPYRLRQPDLFVRFSTETEEKERALLDAAISAQT